MATRFGGAHSNQRQAAKLKLIVGSLLVLILLLMVTLVVTSGGGSAPQSAVAVSEPQAPTPAAAPVSPTVEILLSNQRIEQGTQLQAFMFEAHPWDVETLPPGAVLAKDLNNIVGKFANTIINANLPLLEEHVVSQQPISSINIPSGYRAVTINVDSRSGVEGFARPNTRVDILWTYTGDDKKKRVTTIVPFAKVLSVAGATQTEGNKAQINNAANAKTTVTLLVTIKQAKKIELARTLGELSLSLLGDTEVPAASPEDGDEVTLTDLIPAPDVRNEEIPADGVMYTTDQLTGKKVRYLLRSGRWVRDTEAGN